MMARLALLLAVLLTIALGVFRMIPAHVAVLISGVFTLAGSLAGFVLGERWELNWALLAAGLVMLAASSAVARWPERRHRHRSQSEEAEEHHRL